MRPRKFKDGGVYTVEQIGPHRERTPEGYLLCRDVPISRVGDFEYTPLEAGIRGVNGKVILTRSPEALFSPETIASFEGKPVVIGHDTFADDLSLLVEGEQGVSLLLGCAHSGLPNILAYARDHFGVKSFHTVIGGTHLSAFSGAKLTASIEAMKAFDVRHWRPNHCTGFAAAAALACQFSDVQWAGAGSLIAL